MITRIIQVNNISGLLFAAITFVILSSAVVHAQTNNTTDTMSSKTMEEATFGAGCFWCVEAVFEELKGVQSAVAGYAGGKLPNPTYRQVSSGQTGHAEVARITFDPSAISYEQLLEVFWHTHNPTTKNRQGADVGPQYRSAIFYHNEKQKEIAEKSLEKTDQSDLWEDPIVTEIEPLTNYSVAENYHQNYYENNPNAGYCQVVIAPKLKKFRKDFPHLLKDKVKE
ncbi:peptide-methionine (S)-S-oxide reductase [Aliifodinibius salipaludis]|uniref:Peptide methionine sulfoxide reductase MsrA n=1 Tax=Fodinibius salipaludis TaxID=2032627 RepID=A0A2A2GB65_9BACT|nr:peptide-methionine (S)-S-oxide reductase MsrA [Aliifodinibius salipaludis]PAU94107.1 peptide-methionine (S)-S-oxide reductase [Aliifodinibius salipaludis]